MRIYMEESLVNFEFWAGANDFVKYLTYEELVQMEEVLNDTNPEGMSETELNDLFWFDSDYVCECLGIDEEEVYKREARY